MPHTILCVEDNCVVAEAVKDTLEMEGLRVQTCADGNLGLRLIESATPFDLFIFDNELPNVRGIELIRHARRIAYRQHTPIVMLSASHCESEARQAGADAFLKKPDDVAKIVETVMRLLAPHSVD